MEYRTLGRTGCAVSTLTLGTMTFGKETDEAGAHEQLDAFVEAGGTSSTPPTSTTPARRKRSSAAGSPHGRPTSATARCSPPRAVSRWATAVNDVGLSRRHLQRALDASLRRLGVDCVDLYQVHSWDPVTPLEETLGTLDDLVRAGKVRYVGLSNYTGLAGPEGRGAGRARAAGPPR